LAPATGGSGAEATLDLSGTIQGSYGYLGANHHLTGSVKGSALGSDLTLAPGTDPGAIPAWFRGLGVVASGTVLSASNSGRGTCSPTDLLHPQLSLVVPLPQTVPEPASLVIFLSCAGYAAREAVSRSRRRPEWAVRLTAH
jgi:hypothetical protein